MDTFTCDIACTPLNNRLQEVVGDVAVLNSLPKGDVEMQRRVGELIMSRNKAIKVTFSSCISLCHMNYLAYFHCV